MENFDSGMGFESYISSLPHWICKPYLRPQRDDSTASTSDYRERRRAELEVIAEQTGLSKRQIRKREKRKVVFSILIEIFYASLHYGFRMEFPQVLSVN